MTRHVVQHPENTKECDYVIGDVHGAVDAFKLVLNKLQPGDRLFLVGDLIDRRPESPEIIRLIQEKNKDQDTPIVYAVRGNHEEDFLKVMEIIESIRARNTILDADYATLRSFLKNGGWWIFADKKTQQSFRDNPDQRITDKNIKLFTESLIPNETLGNIQSYIQQLPYALVCGELNNPNSFVVCHADMPLNDGDLKTALQDNGTLTEETRKHIVRARAEGAVSPRHSGSTFSSDRNKQPTDGRTAQSALVYCGHNAMMDSYSGAIRSATNSVNLDFGAYDKNRFVLVNHTAKTAQIISSQQSNFFSQLPLRSAVQNISSHLIKQFLVRAKLCNTLEDAGKLVDFFLKALMKDIPDFRPQFLRAVDHRNWTTEKDLQYFVAVYDRYSSTEKQKQSSFQQSVLSVFQCILEKKPSERSEYEQKILKEITDPSVSNVECAKKTSKLVINNMNGVTGTTFQNCYFFVRSMIDRDCSNHDFTDSGFYVPIYFSGCTFSNANFSNTQFFKGVKFKDQDNFDAFFKNCTLNGAFIPKIVLEDGKHSITLDINHQKVTQSVFASLKLAINAKNKSVGSLTPDAIKALVFYHEHVTLKILSTTQRPLSHAQFREYSALGVRNFSGIVFSEKLDFSDLKISEYCFDGAIFTQGVNVESVNFSQNKEQQHSVSTAAAAAPPSDDNAFDDCDAEFASPVNASPVLQQPLLNSKQPTQSDAVIAAFINNKNKILQNAVKIPTSETWQAVWNNYNFSCDDRGHPKLDKLNQEQISEIPFILDDLRKCCGLPTQEVYAQIRLSNGPMDSIIQNSAVLQEKYKKDDASGAYYHYNENNKTLVIVHTTTDMIPTENVPKNAEADKKAQDAALKNLQKTTMALKQTLKLDNSVTVHHLIPEVVSGRARSLNFPCMSAESRGSSRHIRLRRITENQYLEQPRNDLFDPRDFGLSAQNMGDDTNCGRYVAAMTIQAAGLLADDLQLTQENLKASPAVSRALYFNEFEALQTGLKYVYVQPLSATNTLEHYKQKLFCLAAEYKVRALDETRQYHGRNVTPFFGGYGVASAVTTSLFAKTGFAYSAKEKLRAVHAIYKAIDTNDFTNLAPAASQGELKKCVDGLKSRMSEERPALR